MRSLLSGRIALPTCLGLIMTFSSEVRANDQLARDMYYEQLNEPSRKSSNVGFRYWIELQRQGTTSRVNNRYRFRSGDKIKFHIAPDIDGYVHIVMVGGTTGSKSVLFPVAGKDSTNYVSRGSEHTIPSSSFLQFDDNKGCEHLQVALSRRRLSNEELLKSVTPQIAIAASGAPAMKSSELKVSFDEVRPSTSIANAIPDEANARDMFAPKGASKVTKDIVFTPYTTVVSTDASKDLYADISLEHD